MSVQRASVGYDDLATLRLLGLEGGLAGETKVSCSSLADEMAVSTQTVSRRLQRLEAAGLVARDIVSDGQWVTVTDDGERSLREEYQAYRRLFESAGAVDLDGRVTSGMGEGRHYISLPGYRTQFEARLGYDPYPGTLNVELDEESVRRRAALAAIEAVPIDAWEDDERTYGPAHCYPATLTAGDRSYETAHAIVPERTHHDEDQIEIIAPVRLRDELDLEDDDEVTVTVEGSE